MRKNSATKNTKTLKVAMICDLYVVRNDAQRERERERERTVARFGVASFYRIATFRGVRFAKNA